MGSITIDRFGAANFCSVLRKHLSICIRPARRAPLFGPARWVVGQDEGVVGEQAAFMPGSLWPWTHAESFSSHLSNARASTTARLPFSGAIAPRVAHPLGLAQNSMLSWRNGRRDSLLCNLLLSGMADMFCLLLQYRIHDPQGRGEESFDITLAL